MIPESFNGLYPNTHIPTTLTANNSMPISAQEWRVHTGLYNASKRVRLYPHTKTSCPNHGSKESTAKEAESNSHWVWAVALMTMLIPFLPRVYNVLFSLLEVLMASGGRNLRTKCKLSDITNKYRLFNFFTCQP